jgi:hypothetical protein
VVGVGEGMPVADGLTDGKALEVGEGVGRTVGLT